MKVFSELPLVSSWGKSISFCANANPAQLSLDKVPALSAVAHQDLPVMSQLYRTRGRRLRILLKNPRTARNAYDYRSHRHLRTITRMPQQSDNPI